MLSHTRRPLRSSADFSPTQSAKKVAAVLDSAGSLHVLTQLVCTPLLLRIPALQLPEKEAGTTCAA